MCSHLDLPHRLHKGILDCNTDIRARVALAQLTQLSEIRGPELTWCGAYGQLEHSRASRQIWKCDVYTSLETSSNSRIQLPRNICSAKNQHSLRIAAHSIHLYQHLSLDAA